MTMLKNIVAAAVIGSITLATVGSVAQAGDYYGGGNYGAHAGGYGPVQSYDHGPGYGHHAPAPQTYYGGYPQHRRDRTGEKIATGVAIGVGALILGSILANQGRRHHGY